MLKGAKPALRKIREKSKRAAESGSKAVAKQHLKNLSEIRKAPNRLLNQAIRNPSLERETGIGPATPTLARWCSTAEPLAHTVFVKTMDNIH